MDLCYSSRFEIDMGVSLNGGTPNLPPQTDHFS